jgi:thiol-disulfide isomerase/thioredoxin
MAVRIRNRVGAALVAVLSLAGCAPEREGPAGGAGRSDGTASPLDFTAATVAGPPFAGADLVDRPVVLWFWAPWCTICRAEAPEVADVAARLDGRVELLGVAGGGPVSDMQAFVEQTGTEGLTHIADTQGVVWRRFAVVAQPTFVFVAPSGELTSFAGSLGAEELAQRALALVAGDRS